MGKEALKVKAGAIQDNTCAICGKPIDLDKEDFYMVDTHRPLQKAAGGIYTEPNTRVVHPVCHMKAHGNYRKRLPDIDELKCMVDGRVQILKLRSKIANQLRAYKRRTDYL